MDFIKFKQAVAAQLASMAKGTLYRTNVTKDGLWETYLRSFPAGSDPIFRERTEHDCNCCKQFIRAVGDVVAIKGNKLVSIWDIDIGGSEPEYQAVANGLSAFVKSAKVADFFFHYERSAGTERSFEQIENGTTTWNHFFVNIPVQFVMHKDRIASTLGDLRATHDVMLRGLTEISVDAIDTVLELIAQNSLYRGNEHTGVLTAFKTLKNRFDAAKDKDLMVWDNGNVANGAVARMRNTSIGTLLVDLSAGKELEDAVRAFEAMVAPANYKRPTALVTESMVKKAKEKVEELGLTSALERRYANINDISINNILFADRSAKKMINGDVFDDIATTTKKSRNLDKVEEVGIEKFIADILPRAETVEVMFENKHASNLVSLVAPVDPTANNMFKWSNAFSWSYNGDMADSIKERVKSAGGSVTGDLCCRLAWFNYDDLDFHMHEPGGDHIYFSSRSRKSSCGGLLDVDMNAGSGTTRTPVENIFYASRDTMREGVYTLKVHNFNKRESTGVGFEVEIDMLGEVHNFVYDKAVRNGEYITVAEIKYSKKNGFEIVKSIAGTARSKEVWGLQTQQWHKVNVAMLSPNYWDEQKEVGNKHYFFMLDGCVNDGQARGFFNEYLKEELNAHRKVLEVVGGKMKTRATDNQLSGLGFSSTQRNELLVRVSGAFTRVVKVVF